MNALPASSAASIASCLIVWSSRSVRERSAGASGRRRRRARRARPGPRLEIITPSTSSKRAKRSCASSSGTSTAASAVAAPLNSTMSRTLRTAGCPPDTRSRVARPRAELVGRIGVQVRLAGAQVGERHLSPSDPRSARTPPSRPDPRRTGRPSARSASSGAPEPPCGRRATLTTPSARSGPSVDWDLAGGPSRGTSRRRSRRRDRPGMSSTAGSAEAARRLRPAPPSPSCGSCDSSCRR